MLGELSHHLRALIDRTAVLPQILLTIADNLIKDPENPKYQQFKPTNNTIKRNLVDVKGALEYAVEVRASNPFPYANTYPTPPRSIDGIPTRRACRA